MSWSQVHRTLHGICHALGEIGDFCQNSELPMARQLADNYYDLSGIVFDADPSMSEQKLQAWPERFAERLHIFALGESFDVDAYLAQSTLRPSFIWRKMGNGPTSGLELLLDDRDPIKLHEQEKIAVDFMRQHREELRSLASFPGVEALNLGLVYRITPDTTGCCLGPSRALMFHALDSGVSPNYYVTILGR